MSLPGVLLQLFDSYCTLLRLTRVHENTGLSGDFSSPRTIGANNRTASGHRLRNRQTEALFPRWLKQGQRLPVEPFKIAGGQLAEMVQAAGWHTGQNISLDFFPAEPTVPHDNQRQGGVWQDGVDDMLQILAYFDAPYKQNKRKVWKLIDHRILYRRKPGGWRGDTVENHRASRGIDQVETKQLLMSCPTHGDNRIGAEQFFRHSGSDFLLKSGALVPVAIQRPGIMQSIDGFSPSCRWKTVPQSVDDVWSCGPNPIQPPHLSRLYA